MQCFLSVVTSLSSDSFIPVTSCISSIHRPRPKPTPSPLTFANFSQFSKSALSGHPSVLVCLGSLLIIRFSNRTITITPPRLCNDLPSEIRPFSLPPVLHHYCTIIFFLLRY